MQVVMDQKYIVDSRTGCWVYTAKEKKVPPGQYNIYRLLFWSSYQNAYYLNMLLWAKQFESPFSGKAAIVIATCDVVSYCLAKKSPLKGPTHIT